MATKVIRKERKAVGRREDSSISRRREEKR